MADKLDYSNICTHNDDADPLCWKCKCFIFPIGCMKGEEYGTEHTKMEEVHDYLVKAYDTYNELPHQHPNELDDFAKAIHQCQYVLMARYARMSRPDLFPIKE